MRLLVTKHFDIINNLLSVRYRNLLLALVGMIIVPGLFYHSLYEELAVLFFNATVIYLGIYAIQESRKQLLIGYFFATIILAINKLGIWHESGNLHFYFSFVAYILFYSYLSFRLAKMVIKSDFINRGVLFAAVNIYLLCGIIGAYLFMLIENVYPGSLSNLQLEDITNPSSFIYFSFVTLSTLGYGDITPITPPAQMLSIVLSISGPLYLTIIVALLVSRFDHKAPVDLNKF